MLPVGYVCLLSWTGECTAQHEAQSMDSGIEQAHVQDAFAWKGIHFPNLSTGQTTQTQCATKSNSGSRGIFSLWYLFGDLHIWLNQIEVSVRNTKTRDSPSQKRKTLEALRTICAMDCLVHAMAYRAGMAGNVKEPEASFGDCGGKHDHFWDLLCARHSVMLLILFHQIFTNNPARLM